MPFFRKVKWAIEHWSVDASIGDGLTLYMLTKSEDPKMVSKWVYGDKVVLAKNSNVASEVFVYLCKVSIDPSLLTPSSAQDGEGASSGASGKNSKNMGRITVAASAAKIAELVNESADRDS